MKYLSTLSMILSLLFFSSSISQTTDERFNQEVEVFIQKIMSNYEIPGLALGIVKDGEIFYSKGFGVKNLETGVPLTESTIFHMAYHPL